MHAPLHNVDLGIHAQTLDNQSCPCLAIAIFVFLQDAAVGIEGSRQWTPIVGTWKTVTSILPVMSDQSGT